MLRGRAVRWIVAGVLVLVAIAAVGVFILNRASEQSQLGDETPADIVAANGPLVPDAASLEAEQRCLSGVNNGSSGIEVGDLAA